MIQVKLASGAGQQGEGPVSSYMLETGANVSALIEMARVSLDGRKVRVNGDSADVDTRLNDGDVVVLYQKVSGGTV